MLIFLAVFAFAVVAGFNPALYLITENPKVYFRLWASISLLTFLVALIIEYFMMPSFASLLGGLGWSLLILWTVSAAISTQGEKFPSLFILGVFLLNLGWSIYNTPGVAQTISGSESKLIGEVKETTWNNVFESPTNPLHIRMVPRVHALTMMRKLMGQSADAEHPNEVLGSLYSLDEDRLTLQKVMNRLEWVCPLEINDGLFRQRDYLPGYARISAEDPNAVAEFISKVNGKPLHMKYFPSALWDSQLTRYLLNSGYIGVNLVDYTFETDDDGYPYWGITKTVFTKGAMAEKVAGLLLVDPTDGKIQEFAPKDAPKWVDRIMPSYLTHYYVEAWGMLKNGWNVFNVDREATKVVEEGPKIIFGDDGSILWHTGITSPNSKDDALSGFIHTDARTGVSRYYRMSNISAGHGEAARNAANAALKAENIGGVTATDPIPYLIFGRLAYVTPAVGENGIFKRLIIVDAQNVNHVGIGTSKEEALNGFRSALVKETSDGAVKNASSEKTGNFTVARVATEQRGRSQYYLVRFVEVPKNNFAGTLTDRTLDLPFAKEGDKVTASYFETGNSESQIRGFDVLNLK